MTSEQRTTLRQALIAQGFKRTGYSRDGGDGVYTETWRIAQGNDEVIICWGAPGQVGDLPEEAVTTQAERKSLREVLVAAGFGFEAYSNDQGAGRYEERWTNGDDRVVVAWGGRFVTADEYTFACRDCDFRSRAVQLAERHENKTGHDVEEAEQP